MSNKLGAPALVLQRQLHLDAGKLAGLDKKLSRSLDEDVRVSSSPLEYSKSPVGPLSEASR